MTMNVSIFPWLNKPGFPTLLDSTFSESLDVTDPYRNPVRSGKWFNYDIYKNKPVPPVAEWKLPDQLYCICNTVKRFDADFFYCGSFFKFLVSEAFLNFIKENNLLEGEYDCCNVNLVSRKKEPIVTTKKYFYLRIFRFHDHLVDWNQTQAVKKERSVVDMFYYKNITLKKDEHIPDLFFINKPLYANTFFCNDQIKNKIQAKNFLRFSLIHPDDFVVEQQFRDKNPYPDKTTMQERDKRLFQQL